MPVFMTDGWAQQLRARYNDWPDEQRKAGKLQDFWDWINMIRPFVTGRLVLAVRDLPAGRADGDALVLDFQAGTVTAASIGERVASQEHADFLLAASYEDWIAMLEGYDVGKMIMYRRLMLEKGDTLMFFTAAFFWTELLAAIQSIPVEVAAPV